MGANIIIILVTTVIIISLFLLLSLSSLPCPWPSLVGFVGKFHCILVLEVMQ